jgi:PAS domain S-box-containing protein
MAVGAALGLRVALDPWLGARTPYITVFGAVIVAAWYGGFGPGLVAAAVGWIGSDLLFVEPRGRLAFRGAAQLIELFAYALSTLLIAALGGAMQRARQRSEASEQRFRAFMQNSPNGVFLKDEDGRYLFMNRTGEGLASRTDWLGKTDEELFGGRVAREIRDHDHAAADRAYWLGRRRRRSARARRRLRCARHQAGRPRHAQRDDLPSLGMTSSAKSSSERMAWSGAMSPNEKMHSR